MSLLATDDIELCLAKMRKMTVSSKRIPNRQILLCFSRQAFAELPLFCLQQGCAYSPSRPTRGRASGVRKFHTS
jgi:hypothetical protein